MIIAETHIIRESNLLYKELDSLCFSSKNLYNSALYQIRQHFFQTGKYLGYKKLQKILQDGGFKEYKSLPAKVSQQVLKLLDKNFVSFFKSLKSEKVKKAKIPKYKDKLKGRNICIYTSQAVSKKELKRGFLKLSGTSFKLNTKVKHKDLRQVRIVPIQGAYKIEILYKKETNPKELDLNRVASIDLGVNNLATVAFSCTDIKPLFIEGRPLKSINQFFNKKKAELQSYLREGKYITKRISKLILKRNCKVQDYLHKTSTKLINHLVLNNIGTLVIGYNQGWKQEISLGKRNNQNFVNIPFKKFIDYLSYKAELVGIFVQLQEESYTSKCSFLDEEAVCKHESYAGRRVKRGLFKSGLGKFINADLNGAYNILKKAFPGVFYTKGIEGVVVHPIRLKCL